MRLPCPACNIEALQKTTQTPRRLHKCCTKEKYCAVFSQSSQSDTLQLLLLAQINVYFIGCCFDIVKETHHALQMCISRNGQNSPLGSDLKTAGMLCTVCFLSKYVFLLFDCATYLNLQRPDIHVHLFWKLSHYITVSLPALSVNLSFGVLLCPRF